MVPPKRYEDQCAYHPIKHVFIEALILFIYIFTYIPKKKVKLPAFHV